MSGRGSGVEMSRVAPEGGGSGRAGEQPSVSLESGAVGTDDPLPLSWRLAYGQGEVPNAIMATVTGFFLSPFLLGVAGLNGFAAGIIVIAGRVFDSVTDPALGTLSDRTKHRLGRRRSWMLYSIVPCAISYFALWQVPPGDMWAKFGYYLFWFMMLNLTFTAYTVPYASITPDLTRDSNMYGVLTKFRMCSSVTAILISVGVVGTINDIFADPICDPDNPEYDADIAADECDPDIPPEDQGTSGPETGYLISSIIMSIAIVVTGLIPVFVLREKPPEEDRKPTPLIAGVKSVLKNRPYVILSLVFFMCWVSINLVQANLVFYMKHCMQMENDTTLVLMVVLVNLFIGIVIWTAVFPKIGKKTTYFVGLSFAIVAFIILYFMPARPGAGIYIVSVFAGFGISIAYLIPWAQLPDCIDYHELHTGERNEGVFYSFFVFFTKLGVGLAIAGSNFALGAADFDDDVLYDPETSTVAQTIRVAVGWIPTTLILISFVLMRMYPLDQKTCKENAKLLYAKKLKTQLKSLAGAGADASFQSSGLPSATQEIADQPIERFRSSSVLRPDVAPDEHSTLNKEEIEELARRVEEDVHKELIDQGLMVDVNKEHVSSHIIVDGDEHESGAGTGTGPDSDKKALMAASVASDDEQDPAPAEAAKDEDDQGSHGSGADDAE